MVNVFEIVHACMIINDEDILVHELYHVDHSMQYKPTATFSRLNFPTVNE